MQNSRAAKPGTPAAPSMNDGNVRPSSRNSTHSTGRREFLRLLPQLTAPAFTSVVRELLPVLDIRRFPAPMLFIAGEGHSIEFQDAYRLAAEPKGHIVPRPGMWIMTGQALSPSANSPTSLRKT
ncbi:MAG: hypothetical protein ACLSHC_05310 [Bilophila wadsworthia]